MADRPSIAESLKRRAEANAANADKDPFASNGDTPPAAAAVPEPAVATVTAPAPTPVAAAVKEETVKLTVVIPETVNHRLKMKAVGDRTNIAALVRIWIDDYLAAP